MICFKCKEDKSIEDFHKRSDNGKTDSYCKDCRNSYNVTYYSENILQERERSRLKHYKQKYNIVWEDKIQMYEDQNGICACCSEKMPPVEDVTVHVEHNHKTKEVRSLVHRRCNWVISYAENFPEIVNLAIKYVKRFNMRIV